MIVYSVRKNESNEIPRVFLEYKASLRSMHSRIFIEVLMRLALKSKERMPRNGWRVKNDRLLCYGRSL
jgi:hypothetical protein